MSQEVWLPIIEKDFSKKLKEPFTIYIDSVDKQTICFVMKNMFYGKYPSFDEIIQCIAEFENVLNDSILSNGK